LRILKCRPDELGGDQIQLWEHFLQTGTHGGSPFMTYEFAKAVQDVRGNAFVLDIETASKARGFLPIQMRTGLSGLGHAEKLGSSMSDYFGIVGNIHEPLDQDELLRSARLSSLRFDHGIDEMCPFSYFDKEVSEGVRVSVPDSSLYLEMLAASDKEFVRSVQRSKRQFERDVGPLRFDWHSDDAAALEWLISTKSEQYRRTGVANALSTPWRRQLLYRLLDEPASSRCRAIISTLKCDGRWIAASLNLMRQSTLHVWYPVYDIDFRKYSPGHLLFLRMFEQATEHGVDLVDFGKGPAKYKMKYRGDIYPLYSGVARRKTLSGKLDRVFQSAEWRMTALRNAARRNDAEA
jgi:CelD/BcsL family acetyltransferase involved in cellulose biosynthesis